MELQVEMPDGGFQSTPLIRGETKSRKHSKMSSKFQSTPLIRGETLIAAAQKLYEGPFQSTPLIRGETQGRHAVAGYGRISIHSPHTRGDASVNIWGSLVFNFNPLPSYEGRRRAAGSGTRISCNFNPLPSYEGRQHKPPKIHPDLRQLTQQNHDTPLFGALQAPFCGAEPDIRGAKPTGKP